jgi:hypothetical protein
MADQDEEKLLRSVALQNAQAVLRARERAERELIKRGREEVEDSPRPECFFLPRPRE